MVCARCKVAHACPEKGSSPLVSPGKHQMMCKIIGGYGKTPIDLSLLSEETRAEIGDTENLCLTIAEVPAFDQSSGKSYVKIVKIFSKPILHPREKVTSKIQMMYPRSYGGKHPK